ncbi:hypothetical protein D3C71_1444030 [compost metagenome]
MAPQLLQHRRSPAASRPASQSSMIRVVPAPAGSITSGRRASKAGVMRVSSPNTAGAAAQAKRASPIGVDAMFAREDLPAMTAKSSSPSATRCSSTWPMSTYGSSTRSGYAARTTPIRRGSQVKAVSSPTPKRQRPRRPGVSAMDARTWSAAASNSRACGTSRCPASVSAALCPLRSNSGWPSASSSSVMRLDSEDTDRCRRSAATAKLAQVAAQ